MGVYRELLGDHTIHVEDTAGNPKRRYEILYKTYTEDHQMRSLAGLNGAGHSQATLSMTDYNTWEPCDSDILHRRSDRGGQKANLGVQLLRVCRQIHSEAASLLYTENYFIIASRITARFLEAFLKQFGIEQRRLIRAAALFDLTLTLVDRVPVLLPGLRQLWIGLGPKPYIREHGAMQKNILKESFTRIKFANLVGVAVMNHAWINNGYEDSEEEVEKALLDRRPCKCDTREAREAQTIEIEGYTYPKPTYDDLLWGWCTCEDQRHS